MSGQFPSYYFNNPDEVNRCNRLIVGQMFTIDQEPIGGTVFRIKKKIGPIGTRLIIYFLSEGPEEGNPTKYNLYLLDQSKLLFYELPTYGEINPLRIKYTNIKFLPVAAAGGRKKSRRNNRNKKSQRNRKSRKYYTF